MNDYDSCNGEDDDYGILKQALEVDLPNNFNPDKVPQTGEEYLQHVVYERKQCKTWVTVDIDRNKFKNKQTLKIEADDIIETPQTLLPTIKWQNEKIEDFTKFRKFIQSKLTIESNVSSFDEADFLKKIVSVTPTFSQMIKYTQAGKIRMLELISKYLSTLETGFNIEDNLGTWLYAIFALLEIPLSPSSCYTLREFCKKCQLLRSKLSDNNDRLYYVPLNLYICIVARYFNQLDLADS